MVRPLLLGALAGLLLLGACTGEGDAGDAGDDDVAGGGRPESARPPADVTFGLTQLIPEEGTDQALLRVTNTRAEPLEVTAVGLDWPGYGPTFVETNDAVVAAGQTLDLRTTLPTPVCEEAPTPPSTAARGVLETTTGRVDAPLKASSQTYLHRLWRTQCDAALVEASVRVEVDGPWLQEGAGEDASVSAPLVLVRVDGADDGRRLEARRAAGSVLYDVALDRPLVVPPGEARTEGTVRVLPGNRCDEHARGQATAPFDFSLQLVVGERRVLVPLPVDTAAANAAQRLLDRVCGKVTTADG